MNITKSLVTGTSLSLLLGLAMIAGCASLPPEADPQASPQAEAASQRQTEAAEKEEVPSGPGASAKAADTESPRQSDKQADRTYSFDGWNEDATDGTAVVEGKRVPGSTPTASTTAPDIKPTVVSFAEPDDPLRGFNKAMFSFNDVAYRYALIPLATGYDAVTPQPVKSGIGNFFSNLKEPISLLNNVLQIKPKNAGTNIARFGINTTLGIAGIFDPADRWFGIKDKPAGFGDTLSRYGVGAGPYVVLPFLGPTDLRGTVGTVGDALANPIPYAVDQPESSAIVAFDGFQDATPTLLTYGKLRGELEDPYTFFRNLYIQGRERDALYGPGIFSFSNVGAEEPAAETTGAGE